MVQAHGGTVEALPGIDGQGTILRITLPIGRPHGTMDA
jgi:two-component system sensor histidine kinase KdpD